MNDHGNPSTSPVSTAARPNAQLGSRFWLGAAFALLGLSLSVACGEEVDDPAPDDCALAPWSCGPGADGPDVKTMRTSNVDKIDLLFVIDNSVSMAEKQRILKESAPNLLGRLMQPDCLNEDHAIVAKVDGTCPEGSKLRFAPVNDIHIATITSSLGAHGGTVCDAPTPTVDYPNDLAHLIPSVRPQGTVPDPDGTGFLSWTGGAQYPDSLLADFQSHVVAAGERGCGYEATLEAWYRFLVDPHPPTAIVKGELGVSTRASDDDSVLLEQRNAFLRSDSLVAIVMLSDENDCSILDQGNGWAVSTPDFEFKPASSVCSTRPDDKCCYSCFAAAPEGCAADEACADASATLPRSEDRGSVRCALQKERFGLELLWPTERYIEALSNALIVDAWDPSGPTVPNPLFIARNGAGPRDMSHVILAGIIGVPWQDIADEASQDPGNAGLTYLTAAEIYDNGKWDVILGNAGGGIQPTDARMIESIKPRDGLANHTTPWADPIHGNDFDNSQTFAPDGSTPANDDLQYACVFPLAEPIDCTLQANQDVCDCFETADLEKVKPLCQNGAGAPQENTQYFAKAYPGTRFLEVLKGVEDKAVVASICPKNPTIPGDPTNPTSGYNPAVDAIIDRMSELMGALCFPRELDVDATTGEVPCRLVEAMIHLDDPSCSRPGREALDGATRTAVIEELKSTDVCGGATGVDCNAIETCGIRQFTEEVDRIECYSNPNATTPGFCYIDPAQGPTAGGQQCDGGNMSCTNPFVQDCPSDQRRTLRILASPETPTPAKGAVALLVCQ